MRFRLCAAAILIASIATLTVAPVAAVAQSTRPLAIEDFYKIKTIATPSISPDAQWVAFAVTMRIEESNGTQSDVWLVPVDGSAAARKVSGAASATNPRWTDDGRLQFTAGAQAITIDPRAPDRVDSTQVTQAGSPSGRGGGRGGPRRSTFT